MSFLFLLATLDPAPLLPPRSEPEEILVTASRIPVQAEDAGASATVIDERRLEALGLRGAADYLRLVPGVSVSASGSQGALTQVRIRGAEANHSLVFVDGIAFNDLAAANEARFEALDASLVSRIEVVRGPQSALWGSEALGGVVSIATAEPFGARRVLFSAEAGSRGGRGGSALLAKGGQRAGIVTTFGWTRSDGIDVLGGGNGDRDGFDLLSASLKGAVRLGSAVEIGAVARLQRLATQFDGTDASFRRADTLDESQADADAARAWLHFGDAKLAAGSGSWALRVEGQIYDSSNHNRRAGLRINESRGRRIRYGAQVEHRGEIGGGSHQLIVAAERETETFRTREPQPDGLLRRELDRSRTALVGEWRAEWGSLLVTDVALRHDAFDRFADETTLRASAILRMTSGWSLFGSWSEGIAQPGFADLFGFAPGSGFVGNPDLRPEHARGAEAGLRWQGDELALEVALYSSALRDEIVEDFSIFPLYRVVNAPGTSRRRGIEWSGDWTPSPSLRLSASYAWTDTRERREGGDALREVRRPPHSFAVHGDWRHGPISIGGALSWVGERVDRDFDQFPAPRVRLDPYLLASLKVAWRASERIELYGRMENGFDAHYQDVVGYDVPGRSVHAGIRLLWDG